MGTANLKNKKKIIASSLLTLLEIACHITIMVQFFYMMKLSYLKKLLKLEDSNGISFEMSTRFAIFFLIMFSLFIIQKICAKFNDHLINKENNNKTKSFEISSIFTVPIIVILKILIGGFFFTLGLSAVYIFLDEIMNNQLFSLTEETIKIIETINTVVMAIIGSILGILIVLDFINSFNEIIKHNSSYDNTNNEKIEKNFLSKCCDNLYFSKFTLYVIENLKEKNNEQKNVENKDAGIESTKF
jgi:hypothetical protein